MKAVRVVFERVDGRFTWRLVLGDGPHRCEIRPRRTAGYKREKSAEDCAERWAAKLGLEIVEEKGRTHG